MKLRICLFQVTSNGVEEEETAWSWDVAQDSGGPDKEEVEFLKQKIKTLEIEKRDLVQSLEQLDLDCQQTTDKLITLKDELQDDYSNLKIQFSDLRKSNDFLQGSDAKNKKQLQKIQEENKKLLKIVEELKTNKNNQINLLKNQPQENVDSKFQEENVLKRFENLRSSHDEENVRQQEIIKSYEAKLKEVVENHKKLDEENRKLIFEKKNYEQLQNDFEEYKKKSQETHAAMVDPEDYHKLSAILQAYEEKVNENKNELFATREELTSLKKENEELKSNQENEKKLREENFQKQNQEEFELNLIKHLNENLKKFVDYEVSLEENETFHKMTETVIKLILDVKWKTETLEKELLELTQEKTKILTEKNHEIEKLLQNSEILSQEVITKSQALKHYETECGELIKNNDLLITELDSYKNSSGLQTISESNEDNILLLESQLENANKRIRDLELTINDLEAAKQDVNIEVQSELEYIKKQLNLTGIELSQNKKEYKELQEKYEAVSNENLRLKSERNELSNAMERIKNDYENTEYKYVEMNIDMETLREEVETHKKHSDDLSIFNKKLEMLNTNNKSKSEVLAKEVESLKEELMEEVDSKHLLENRARNLTEKLQNAKMSETSLKLQFDTLQKELVLVADAKESTQRNYRETIHEIREKYEKVCAELETHENLKLENVALRNKIDQVCSEQASNDPKLELNVSEEEIKETSNLNDSDEFKQLAVENSSLRTKLQLLTEENFKLNRAYTENIQKLNNLEANFNQLNASQNELIALIQIKHQENVQYHSEIQRLSQLLNNETEKNKKLLPNSEEHEKIADQNKFLREKCELLAQNLLQEQSNLQKVLADRAESISEREQTLTKELDRLKSHLLEVEDTYTKELLGVEEKNQEIQLKLNEVEQREKNSSTMYTSVNIRANQQVETLQNQLQLVTVQRDDLRQKVSDHEDEIGKQSAALTNLQLVLKQFQKGMIVQCVSAKSPKNCICLHDVFVAFSYFHQLSSQPFRKELRYMSQKSSMLLCLLLRRRNLFVSLQ